MNNNEVQKLPQNYDESFKILMTDYFSKFAKVITDYEIIDLPKRVDILIIEVNQPIEQYVELFKYFKRYNIIEFKSERNRFKSDEDLYKLGIYIGGVLLKESEANPKNTTFTIVSSLKPARFLKQYNAEQIRQGLYIIEDISIVPIHVVVTEEIELSLEKELGYIKGFTSKKDRFNYIRSLVQSNKSLKNIDILLRNVMIHYAEEFKKIIYEEGIMTTTEKNVRKLIKTFGLDKELINFGKQQGLQQGLKSGRIEALENIAIKALSKGMAIEEISEITGLSIEQIKKLKN